MRFVLYCSQFALTLNKLSFTSAIKTNVICFVLLSVCINFAGGKRK